MTLTKTTQPVWAKGVSTAVFAINNHVQAQTPRKQYCLNGSYFGIIPQKLASGRLVWPNVIVTAHGPVAANDEPIAGTDGVK